MNEISEFLYEEMQNAADNINKIKDSIRTVKTDISAVDSYLYKVRDEIDSSEILFKSQTYDTNFNDSELNNLYNKKSEYLYREHVLENELSQQTERLERLKKLLDMSLNGIQISEDFENFTKKEEHIIGINELYNQENDRRRIAMDIHDTVIQDLAAIVLKNEFIAQILSTDLNRARLEIKNSSNILNSCISQLREIIFDLRPMPLENSNFKESFFKTMELLQKKTDKIIYYEYKGDDVNEDYIVLVNILKMVRELCQNAIKHTDGTQINAVIDVSDKKIDIEVRDNGSGFDYNRVAKATKGQGLSMIRDRVYIFGGTFKVTRNKKDGMRFDISIPLKHKEKQMTEMG